MKKIVFIVFSFVVLFFQVVAQTVESVGFRWGNGFYYNLDVGEAVTFKQSEVRLLKVENHYNLLKVGEDTLWLKVARRSVPEEINGVRVFVADNKNVKALAPDARTHGLLKKDALICLSDADMPLLDPLTFAFPVSFNDGFTWNAGEDSYLFSFYKTGETENSYSSYPGVGFNLYHTRGRKEHWLVAVENSSIVWVENFDAAGDGTKTCVLLKSESEPGIYYLYDGLFTNSIVVKKGQELKAGDAIGTSPDDKSGVHFHFAVIHSSAEPTIGEVHHNIVNGFPQLFGLYFRQVKFVFPNFTRGKIVYGLPRHLNNNQLNTQEFEDFSGNGWITGKWNPADKVEWVASGREGNARLKKVMFEATPARSINPGNFFEYKISVRNGTYRIRAKVGDLFLPSWQKIEFGDITVGVKELAAGDFEWTSERIVKVQDGKLTVRLFVDNDNKRVAGISELVFQQIH